MNRVKWKSPMHKTLTCFQIVCSCNHQGVGSWWSPMSSWFEQNEPTHTDHATLLISLWQFWHFLSPATGLGTESSLRGPQLRVHIQRFPLPFSGQPRASRLTHANMLPIPQPQLPESHSGWLFPRWRHSVHRLRLLPTTDWHHCSHLQHQHWWVIDWKQKMNLLQINLLDPIDLINWDDFIWLLNLGLQSWHSEPCSRVTQTRWPNFCSSLYFP